MSMSKNFANQVSQERKCPCAATPHGCVKVMIMTFYTLLTEIYLATASLNHSFEEAYSAEVSLAPEDELQSALEFGVA